MDAEVYDVRDKAYTGAYAIGNQEKWFLADKSLVLKAPFFEERYYKDFIVERLAYVLGQQLGFNVAEQQVCWIERGNNKVLGTASAWGLGEFESYTTFFRMVCNLPDALDGFNGRAIEGFWGIRDTFAKCCGVDTLRYLFEMLCLDLLTGNSDRHLNNFGIVYNHETRRFSTPKIFDSGLGLFEYPFGDGVLNSGGPSGKLDGKSEDKLEIQEKMYSILQSVRLKPFVKCSPLELAQEVLAEGCSRMWRDYTRQVDLSGEVFPSLNGLEYFKCIARILKIEVLGEPIICKERLEYIPARVGDSHGARRIPVDCTLMYKDTPLLQIRQQEDGLYPLVIADRTKYQDFPLEFRIAERPLNINYKALKNFFKFRSVPELRQNKQSVYEGFDVLRYADLCKKAHYLCIDDHYWIKFDGEELKYSDVRIRPKR